MESQPNDGTQVALPAVLVLESESEYCELCSVPMQAMGLEYCSMRVDELSYSYRTVPYRGTVSAPNAVNWCADRSTGVSSMIHRPAWPVIIVILAEPATQRDGTRTPVLDEYCRPARTARNGPAG